LTKNEKELWNDYQSTMTNNMAASRRARSKFIAKHPGKQPTAADLMEYGYDVNAAANQLAQKKQRLIDNGFTIKNNKWYAPDGTNVSNKGKFQPQELFSDPPVRVDGRGDTSGSGQSNPSAGSSGSTPGTQSSKYQQAREKALQDIQTSINDYFTASEKTKVIPQIQKAVSDLKSVKDSSVKKAISDYSLNATEASSLQQEIDSQFEYKVTAAWERSYNSKPREAVADPEKHVSDNEAYDIRKKYAENIKAAKQHVTKTIESALNQFEINKQLPTETVFDNYVKNYIDQVAHKSEFFPVDMQEKERACISDYIYQDVGGDLLNKYRELAKGDNQVTAKTPGEIIANGTGKTNEAVKPKVTSSNVSGFAKTNISFSGCDMVITADMVTTKGTPVSVMVGEAQTISYSIYRKLSPILNIGNINAKDYVGGPRTIAGSLVMTVFNQHWGTQLIDQFAKIEGYASSRKVLMDELAPMNITISMANEYGICSRLAIYSVRIFSEGQVMSINDIFTENTFQYVALNIDYLADVNTKEDLEPLYRDAIAAREKMTEEASKTGIDKSGDSGNTPPNQGGGDSVTKDGKIEFDPNKSQQKTPAQSSTGQDTTGTSPTKPNAGTFPGANGESIPYGNNKQEDLLKAAKKYEQYMEDLQEKLAKIQDIKAAKTIYKEIDRIKGWYTKIVRLISEHYDIQPIEIRTDKEEV